MPNEINGQVHESSDRLTSPFDRIKQQDQDGEFWFGRDIQKALGYVNFQNFESSIRRASTSCRNTGLDPADHVVSIDRLVCIGSGAKRKVADYRLTRYACYLVALNGDPDKPEVAAAQQYFVIRTRESEIRQERQLTYRERRIERLRAEGWSEEQIATRDNGVTIRKHFTKVLKNNGCEGRDIAKITDEENLIITGMRTSALRRARDVPRNGDTRDYETDMELAMNILTETMAREKINGDVKPGPTGCFHHTVDAANGIKKMVGTYFK